MKAWIGAHTGLPCFYSPNAVRLVAADGRVLSDGAAEPTVVSDALAVPGVPTAYSWEGVGESGSAVLVREDSGHALVSARTGRSVPVVWTGEDRVSVEVPGAYTPGAYRWAVGERRKSGALTFRTVGGTSAAVEALLATGEPLIVIHSPSACQVGGCDIPPVRVVVAKDAEHERTGRVDKPVREWNIGYESAPGGITADAVPILIWQDWQQRSTTWQGKAVEVLLREVAGMR